MSTHSWQPSAFDLYQRPRRPRSVSLVAGLALASALFALVAISRPDSVAAPAPEAALSFVANAGQESDAVRFAAHAGGASFFFTPKAAVLAFERGDEGLALRLGFVGANPAPEIEGQGGLAAVVNHLVGDPSEWRTGIPTFGEVVYRDLWPGIDMVFRGANGKLKYELVVAPGADPSRIGLAYLGADGLALAAGGALLIETPFGTLRDEKPRSFQVVDGRRVPVESSFALRGGGYGFALGPYDRSRALVVDPGLLFATYLGGSGAGFDEATNLALGADGSTYVTGYTQSTDFPTTAGAFDRSHAGDSEVFVTKLDPTGALVYSTFLGGSAGEGGSGIVVDAAGHAYVAGGTSSSDFPTTPGALATVKSASGDAFLTKLSSDGSTLVYSTYLGAFGVSRAADVAVDGSGAAVVVGNTSGAGFPTTPGAFDGERDGTNDMFVAKLNAAGSALAYSTYLGGQECDLEQALGVAVDVGGSAYVTGITSAVDFPTTPDAFDTTSEACSGDGQWDAFVTKVAADGTDLAYSTFLNGELGNQDVGFGVAVDASGSAYVVGATYAPDFPTTSGAYDRSLAGNLDGYVAKLNPPGSALVFSTYLGGTGSDNAVAVAVGSDGRVYVSGGTGAADFPTTPGAFDETKNANDDAFLARLDASGSLLEYGSYFGGSGEDFGLWGIGVDGGGNAVFSGYTSSVDLPTSSGAFDPTFNGGFYDGWVAKLATGATAPDGDGDGIPDEVDIEPIRDRIDALISANPGSPAADKLEDSLAKVDSAIAKLAASDRQAALGELEGAVGDIQAAVTGRTLDTATGTELMRDIAAFARIIATQAIDAAKARNGNARKIAEAEAARAQGDARVTRDRFKEAVAKYKDAVAKADAA